MTTDQAILIVEDNEDDVFLLKRSLKAAGVENQIFVVEDGQEAIDYVAGVNKYSNREYFPIPSVVFLDLKLPRKSGHEVLAWIRSQPEHESLTVIVLTSSVEPLDLSRAYRLGANSYVVKPATMTQLAELAKAFHWHWLKFNDYTAATKGPV